ncbi:hypothetical protein PENSPDRAFT_637817 [Peniophora sp. CONT]|nr:hypothetical protein PENSPDRAFT_637817 [Peniophora sp. CONT]
MLSCIAKALSLTSETYPSAVITVGEVGEYSIIHVIPEDGEIEQYGYTFTTKYRYGKAKERSREQLGTVTLEDHGGDDMFFKFARDLFARVKELRDAVSHEGGFGIGWEGAARVVEEALRPAALGALRDREGRTPSTNASSSSSYPLFLVHIDRPKPDSIISLALTCIAS